MKKLFLLVFIFSLLTPLSSSGKVIDQVVGVVDGDVITLSDLDAAMPRYGMANILDAGNPLDKEIKQREARKQLLAMLIEEKLLERAAGRFNIKVENEEVDQYIAKMKQDGNIDDARMKKDLTASGFSVEGYRQFLKVQIRRARIVDAFIKPNVSMSEEKLREYYKSHAGDYLSPEVRVSQILIQVPPEATPKDWEAAKTRMKAVLQRLQKGATFEATATRYSDDKASAPSGGDLGFFKKGEMVPLLEGTIFTMEVKQVSGVVQSSQGLLLFKVTEKKQGEILPFEEAKAQVMEDHYRKEVTRLYVKWLEDIKARSDIEMKL